MNEQSLIAWLAEQGLRNLPLEEMVDGFSRRLNDAGVPVARVFVGMNTLHRLPVSQAFAAATTASHAHLVSVGRHRLRGVREETELFGLSQDVP